MQNPTEIAPCLASGPLATSGMRLVEAASELGSSRWATVLRSMAVYKLFIFQEDALKTAENPLPYINTVMDDLADLFTQASQSHIKSSFDILLERANNIGISAPIEQVTGEHYGNLFKDFSDSSYFDEPLNLLKSRLERNGILPENLAAKTMIDVGCGGGRYTVAWHNLGVKQATGYDISEIGLQDARKRIETLGIKGVNFEQGDVLDIPYKDDSFDIVFSNGVLHHTSDWCKGIRELVRIMKPGGFGWLYLIENPGGIFWDKIEILRAIMQNDDRSIARASLALFGIPSNRIFYMLDHVMVPINVRETEERIRMELTNAGANKIKRLHRGADFDRIEQIYNSVPYSDTHFGVGEHRFVFSK